VSSWLRLESWGLGLELEDLGFEYISVNLYCIPGTYPASQLLYKNKNVYGGLEDLIRLVSSLCSSTKLCDLVFDECRASAPSLGKLDSVVFCRCNGMSAIRNTCDNSAAAAT
jgi:hypothetical protein